MRVFVTGGTGFTGATTVTIGGVSATITSVTATTLNITTPAGVAGAVDVVVTSEFGADTLVGGYTFL